MKAYVNLQRSVTLHFMFLLLLLSHLAQKIAGRSRGRCPLALPSLRAELTTLTLSAMPALSVMPAGSLGACSR